MRIAPQTPTVLLRITYTCLFLWFGTQQVLHPSAWVSFLPEFTGYFPVPGEMLVQLNGWLELCLAALLALGVYTRPVACFLGLHLAGIAISAGGATGVRDGALAMIGTALTIQPADPWTFDHRTQPTA